MHDESLAPKNPSLIMSVLHKEGFLSWAPGESVNCYCIPCNSYGLEIHSYFISVGAFFGVPIN